MQSSEFAIQVPSAAGDLFLCASADTSCPSNLLAATSLHARKGEAVEKGGQSGTKGQKELGSLLAPRGFSISFIWACLQEEDGRTIGVSLKKRAGRIPER